jgi:DNA-directed RNA polymerase subunit RPC12/RpoP
MLNLFFKCSSCGRRLITDEAQAGSPVDCPDCHVHATIPTTILIQECPRCKQPLKAAAEMNGELVDCPYCDAEVRCPYWQDNEIIFTCRRCNESISVPQLNAGQLISCPKCHGWVRAPEFIEEVGDAAAETRRDARQAKSWPSPKEANV